MRASLKQIVAAFAVSLPLLAFAQNPPADASKPAEPAAAAPAAPAAEPAKPAEAPPAPPKDEGPKFTWYGFVLANAFFDGGTFAAKDYPGQVTRDPAGAGGAVLFSARQSRIGMKVAMKDTNWTGADLGAQLEFDFKAGYLPTSGTATCQPIPGPLPATPSCTVAISAANTPSTAWYNGLMRLRLAYMTATWKGSAGSLQFLAGQAYGLVNGLFAESLAWTADPLFWQAGNIWRRSPQFRLSYNGQFDMVGLVVEAAALNPADAPPAGSVPGAAVDFGAGNRSRSPDIEGHAALTLKLSPTTNFMVGAGINKSKRTYDTGANKKDLSPSMIGLEADFNVPFVEVKGEYFKNDGEADTYNDSSSSVTGAAGTRSLIGSKGFWAQVILKPVPALWVTGGIGDAKGDSGDLDKITASRTGVRAENKQVEAGVIVNAGKAWRFGAEWMKTTSTYLGAAVGDPTFAIDATQFAVSSQLRF